MYEKILLSILDSSVWPELGHRTYTKALKDSKAFDEDCEHVLQESCVPFLDLMTSLLEEARSRDILDPGEPVPASKEF